MFSGGIEMEHCPEMVYWDNLRGRESSLFLGKTLQPSPPQPPTPYHTCSLSRKKTLSTIFHSNLNMCVGHTFPMELE